MRRIFTAVAVIVACSMHGESTFAQTITEVDATKLPRFEVVSVKPGDPDASGGMIGFPPGQFRQENTELLSAFLSAFGVRPYQLASMPDFLLKERFTIVARMPADAPATDRPRMLRAMFIDRFKLTSHIERHQEDGYALTISRSDGRLGPQLSRAATDCPAWLATRSRGEPVDPLPAAAAVCGVRNGRGVLDFGGLPMQSLVQMLSNQVGKPIVDRTGLSGPLDVTEFRFAVGSAGAPSSDDARASDDAPSIFTALQEQLGLKLTPAKALVDRLLIDHIERPDPD